MGFRADGVRLGEHARAGVGVRSDEPLKWKCRTTVEKYTVEDFHAGRGPSEVLDIDGNLLLYGGADVMWLGLKNGLSASTGLKNTYFTNANAAIGVGDSNTAAVATHVDLQASSGATHRYFMGMDATYPTHTTGAAASTSSKMLFKATYSSANGNFAWQEWGIGNRVSQAVAYSGRLLNRKVQSLGTKTSAGVWALTVTLSLA